MAGPSSGATEAKRTPRLFFALVPDASARDGLDKLARELAPMTGGRAPPASNLHLTLAFLGHVPQSRMPEIERVGERVAESSRAFDVVLDTIGQFRDARVAWAGASVIAPELQRLHDALRDALAALELPYERRKFSPHVTLARHTRRAPDAHAWRGTAWRAKELTLMASESQIGGPRYRALSCWPLA